MANAFERRHAAKPRRVIDACVIIAFTVDQRCERYLTKLGIEHKGYITHALLGEVVHGACRHVMDGDVRRSVLRLLEELILEGRLHVLPLTAVSPESIEEVLRALPFLSRDDAFHLAELRTQGYREYVTVDRELTNAHNRRRLAELGIRIVEPTRNASG